MALARVTPERVRLLRVFPFEVRVPPIIERVPPVQVTVLQLVKSTPADTVQVPEPDVRLLAVPDAQVKLPVMFIVGLFAEPVSSTSPEPDSCIDIPPENVRVCDPAVPRVTVLPEVEPELSISTAPP